MQPEDRISRMEAEGTLSPAQAAMLRDSLDSGKAADLAAAPRHRIPRVWLWAALGASLAALILILMVSLGGVPDGTEVQDVTQTLNQPEEYGAMNKSLSTIVGVALFLILPLLLVVWLYNSLVGKEEAVFEAWAQTESNFQRRADLIPALVETVSRYLAHEQETLTAVTQARGEAAGALSAAVEDLLNAQQAAAEFQREQGAKGLEEDAAMQALYGVRARVGLSMAKVLAVAEAYPDLRSADQFLELQAQLEGTENRINVARMRFNKAVGDFNAAIRKLPGSLVAGLGDFKRKAYFRSEEEARSAPDLAF